MGNTKKIGSKTKIPQSELSVSPNGKKEGRSLSLANSTPGVRTRIQKEAIPKSKAHSFSGGAKTKSHSEPAYASGLREYEKSVRNRTFWDQKLRSLNWDFNKAGKTPSDPENVGSIEINDEGIPTSPEDKTGKSEFLSNEFWEVSSNQLPSPSLKMVHSGSEQQKKQSVLEQSVLAAANADPLDFPNKPLGYLNFSMASEMATNKQLEATEKDAEAKKQNREGEIHAEQAPLSQDAVLADVASDPLEKSKDPGDALADILSIPALAGFSEGVVPAMGHVEILKAAVGLSDALKLIKNALPPEIRIQSEKE